ncbi:MULTISPECIES: PepSY domain-containing protein [unclassified Massilia]|uniref:PepSY domain-containing protein n=1 Tax=unclassified Massilia TaxID=2609279 RepID=UPI001B82F76E|nr:MULTISPECIES: PepSY domain-containing protein [unclassified Massilia]MBQ5940449.1 PepSY domain-containing protein [Massilia sp. AB1]MBQ5963594.1 PepSY domain-containing protein [Massilia sp. ZL223]
MAASRLPLWVRRTHKWLSLVVGIQALLWVLGGLYMVVVPIEIVHGDHLARGGRPALAADAPRIDPAALAARYPGMSGFAFKQLGGREVVEVRQGKQVLLADAASGAALAPLGRAQVEALARAAYLGEGELRAIDWLTTSPREVGGRPAPLWAVHFDDMVATTLYYSPYTGELVTRRHALWRWFDFVWMLHIMDYEEREDVNNGLLRTSATAAFAMALSGVWLLVLWLRKRKKP